MIFDHISRIAEYRGLSGNLDAFIAYRQAQPIEELPPGRYTVNDAIYFDVKEYRPHPAEEVGWESHRSYIDIQYLVSGREKMGVLPVETLTVKEPYDEARDRTTYEHDPRESMLRLSAGMFVILFPQDAHHATILDGEPELNRKIVVKVHV